MPGTVNVQCNLNNGLRLNLGLRIWSTYSPALHEMEVLLRPGLNVVDRDLFRAWAEQHSDADVVTGRHIYEV
jgi:hypothetical protein